MRMGTRGTTSCQTQGGERWTTSLRWKSPADSTITRGSSTCMPFGNRKRPRSLRGGSSDQTARPTTSAVVHGRPWPASTVGSWIRTAATSDSASRAREVSSYRVVFGRRGTYHFVDFRNQHVRIQKLIHVLWKSRRKGIFLLL